MIWYEDIMEQKFKWVQIKKSNFIIIIISGASLLLLLTHAQG